MRSEGEGENREGDEDTCEVYQMSIGEMDLKSFFSLSVPRFFSSVRAILQGACHMVAMQISAEPLVRQALRQVFQSRAVLNVKPTKKGKKVWRVLHVTPA
jgi:transcription elongation factor SPT6